MELVELIRGLSLDKSKFGLVEVQPFSKWDDPRIKTQFAETGSGDFKGGRASMH